MLKDPNQITKLWNIHMTIYKNTIQMTKWDEIFIRKMAKAMKFIWIKYLDYSQTYKTLPNLS